MHGGAKGSGAPVGNRNAYKTGVHTAAHRKMMNHYRKLMDEAREMEGWR